MTDSDDFLLLGSSSDIFGKDHLLSNFLQDQQQLSPVIETNFPSPASSTDSLDSPEIMNSTDHGLSINPTALQNLPLSVLQSLAAMYQQNDSMEGFDQFVKFEEDSSSPISDHTPSPPTPSKPKAYRPPRQLECFNCHVTKTPLWRRTPDRAHSLCNACGLYYKQYGSHRPLHVRQKQQPTKQASPTPAIHSPLTSTPLEPNNALRPLLSHPQSEQQQCAQCHYTNSPSWTKNENGQVLCASCTKVDQDRKLSIVSTESGGSPKRPREEDMVDLRANKIPNTSSSTPALFPVAPALPPAPPSIAVQSKEWAEIDDTRFKALLSRMNTQQMHGFLGMLERRCTILRSILVPQQESS
ncbi:hypothetical protein BD560DRAFT_417616 [Blakeslea trispora]|nr:hypothetical protein BD560DRAFT_417616 [Blakeslea trispora]